MKLNIGKFRASDVFLSRLVSNCRWLPYQSGNRKDTLVTCLVRLSFMLKLKQEFLIAGIIREIRIHFLKLICALLQSTSIHLPETVFSRFRVLSIHTVSSAYLFRSKHRFCCELTHHARENVDEWHEGNRLSHLV